MKKGTKLALLIIVMLIVKEACFCQDIIIFRNGDEIKSKVLEVAMDQIKYKKWENINGPTYSASKSEVFMIKYVNGTKDVFKNETNESTPKTVVPADNSIEIIAKTYIEGIIRNNSNQILSVTNFEKVNGIQRDIMGQKIYEIEYAVDVEFMTAGYIRGNGLIGYFSNFVVMPYAPSSMRGRNTDDFGNSYKSYPRGQLIKFRGTITLENTDNGYRASSYKTANYQEIGIHIPPGGAVNGNAISNADDWVNYKIDSKLTVKFPLYPTKAYKNGTMVAERDSSIYYIVSVSDLTKTIGKDSTSLANFVTTEEFANNLKSQLAKKSAEDNYGPITPGKWHNYTCYNLEAIEPKTKVKTFYFFVYIGINLYSLTCIVAKKNNANKNRYFSSLTLN